jgi:asparagine synthase (glutamine-hydrolysing)
VDLAALPSAVWAVEDATTAASGLWGMRLAGLASRDVKVVLAGEGADEALGGYRWYHGQKVFGPLAKLPLSLRKLLLPIVRRWGHGAVNVLLAPGKMGVRRFQAMLAPPHREDPVTLLTPDLLRAIEAAPPFAGPDLPDAFRTWHPFDQLQFFDLKLRMADFIVHVLDRASMSQSVEARVPYLDHELVELCCRIPPRVRMKGLCEKHILRRAMRGILPEEIRLRQKRGTVAPVAHWLRAPLPEFAADALSQRRLAETGYFVPHTVHMLLERHQSGDADHSRELFTVLGLQLWHELFVAAAPGAAAPAALVS